MLLACMISLIGPTRSAAQCLIEFLATGNTNEAGLGFQVSINGDRIVASAGGISVLVFDRDGASWEHVDTLSAFDGAVNNLFGSSVSLDGDLLAIGAQWDSDAASQAGAVYFFEFDADRGWEPVQKLIDPDGGSIPAGNNFGEAVSLSGDLAAVLAPGADGSGDNTGAVYIFRREPSGEWVQEVKLFDAGADVSLDGDRVVMTNPPRVFRRDAPGVWVEEEVELAFPAGLRVDLDGDRFVASWEFLDVFEPFFVISVGAAWVYRRVGETWVEEAMLMPEMIGEGEFFGHTLALEGSRLVIGNDPFAFRPPVKPRTYFYEFQQGSGWTLVETIEPDELSPPGSRPSALDLDNGVLAYGDSWNDVAGENAGAVYTLGFGGPDCNANGENDLCDVASGAAEDENGDGVPDSCQCPGDVNGDGELSILDFIAFQGLFAANDPAADCNEDEMFNILDFVCFQGQFAMGCP